MGIGVPGPVTSTGIVKGCVNLGWGDVPVEEILKDKTGFMAKQVMMPMLQLLASYGRVAEKAMPTL